jgi:hypothetical protein
MFHHLFLLKFYAFECKEYIEISIMYRIEDAKSSLVILFRSAGEHVGFPYSGIPGAGKDFHFSDTAWMYGLMPDT